MKRNKRRRRGNKFRTRFGKRLGHYGLCFASRLFSLLPFTPPSFSSLSAYISSLSSLSSLFFPFHFSLLSFPVLSSAFYVFFYWIHLHTNLKNKLSDKDTENGAIPQKNSKNQYCYSFLQSSWISWENNTICIGSELPQFRIHHNGWW